MHSFVVAFYFFVLLSTLFDGFLYGAKEMPQWVRVLALQPKGMSSKPQHPFKDRPSCTCL